jgi:hypothetical protein
LNFCRWAERAEDYLASAQSSVIAVAFDARVAAICQSLFENGAAWMEEVAAMLIGETAASAT